MCGIIGLATLHGSHLSLNDHAFRGLRDRLAHRGPDGAGFWRDNHTMLGHRLLAIVDPAHGEQPWHTGTPGHPDHQVLTYNGEIYNHKQLRRELESLGHHFTTGCDTETVATALAHWGIKDALTRFRGMFALALYEPHSRTLTLARDPLGIKPLYYTVIQTPQGSELLFSSEIPAILAHPHCPHEPDWVTVSAYLSTIRTTLGSRTMYEGISVIQPGEMVTLNLNTDSLHPHAQTWYEQPTAPDLPSLEEAVSQTQSIIQDSVSAHLQSDVPVCALLSGGLDSSITAQLASHEIEDLRTWCAGAPDTGDNDDFPHAREMAKHLGTHHEEAIITREDFLERWPWMIDQLGVPLSTPNEVAIYTVASALSKHAKVTISGEGADELFAGYGQALALFQNYHPDDPLTTPEACFLNTISWIPPTTKSRVLHPEVYEAAERDNILQEEVRRVGFAHHSPANTPDITPFLHAHRHFNLTGLLGRLDTATMLASVEGRTPFADAPVASFAESLPAHYHFASSPENIAGQIGKHGSSDPFLTKRLLRCAFQHNLPDSILTRPKASFPLPFRSWMKDQLHLPLQSSLARATFTEESLLRIAASGQSDAGSSPDWAACWPILNLTHWLESRWGSQSQRLAA